MYCGIVAAVEASEHCGTKTAVAALTETARSARRASILVAIAPMRLLVCFTSTLLSGLEYVGDGLTSDLRPIYRHDLSCKSSNILYYLLLDKLEMTRYLVNFNI